MSQLFRLYRPDASRVTVLESHAARNPKLSRRAKGLLYELGSLPPDGRWKIRHKWLLTLATDGKHKLQTAVSELREHGYLQVYRFRDGGQFEEAVWIVTDNPDERPLPHPDNRDAVEDLKDRITSGRSPHPDYPYADEPDAAQPDADNPTRSGHDVSGPEGSGTPSTARAKLRDHLGPDDDVLPEFAAVFDGRWAAGIYGQYVSGTRAEVWRDVPQAERPKILAAAMWAYIADADEYDNRLFGRFLERMIREWRATGDTREGLTAGDQKIIDFRRRIEDVDLEASL